MKQFPAPLIRCPTTRGGMGSLSLLTEYTTVASMTLTRALLDTGDLGILTNGMLNQQIMTHGNLPASFKRSNTAFHAHPLALRQLSLMHRAYITLHRPNTGFITLTGNRMWEQILNLLSDRRLPPLHMLTQPRSTTRQCFLHPIWQLGGIFSLEELTMRHEHRTYMRPSTFLQEKFSGIAKQRDIHAARQALNQLTLLLNGTAYDDAIKYTHVSPLPEDKRRIELPHDFIQIPQPNQYLPPPTQPTLRTTSHKRPHHLIDHPDMGLPNTQQLPHTSSPILTSTTRPSFTSTILDGIKSGIHSFIHNRQELPHTRTMTAP